LAGLQQRVNEKLFAVWGEGDLHGGGIELGDFDEADRAPQMTARRF
jgi:hypothetical protein